MTGKSMASGSTLPPKNRGKRGKARHSCAPRSASRIDANDAVMRMLADLDYSDQPNAGAVGQGEEVFISDILGNLIDEEDGIPSTSVSSMPDWLQMRLMEVSVARFERYLQATEAVALSWKASMANERVSQGRALLGYLAHVSSSDRGELGDTDALLARAAAATGQGLMALLPLDCDLDAPVPAVGQAGFEAACFQPMGEGDAGLRDTCEALRVQVAHRAKVVESARSAWLLGGYLLGEARRLTLATPDGTA